MSFIYTEKLKPVIIRLLEEGGHTTAEISRRYNISIFFVREVIKNYDNFYAGQF